MHIFVNATLSRIIEYTFIAHVAYDYLVYGTIPDWFARALVFLGTSYVMDPFYAICMALSMDLYPDWLCRFVMAVGAAKMLEWIDEILQRDFAENDIYSYD